MALRAHRITNVLNRYNQAAYTVRAPTPYKYGDSLFLAMQLVNPAFNCALNAFVSRDQGVTWTDKGEVRTSLYHGANFSRPGLAYETASVSTWPDRFYIALYNYSDDKLTVVPWIMASEAPAAPLTGSAIVASNADYFPELSFFVTTDTRFVIASGASLGFGNERWIARTGSSWTAAASIPFPAGLNLGDLFCLGASGRLHSFGRSSADGKTYHNSVDIGTGAAGTAQLISSNYTDNVPPCAVTIGGATNVLVCFDSPAQQSAHGVSGISPAWTLLDMPIVADPKSRKLIPMGDRVEAISIRPDKKGIEKTTFQNGNWSPVETYWEDLAFPYPITALGGGRCGLDLAVTFYAGGFAYFLGPDTGASAGGGPCAVSKEIYLPPLPPPGASPNFTIPYNHGHNGPWKVGNKLYASGEQNFGGPQIHKSVDGGATWAIASVNNSQRGRSACFDPSRNRIVILCRPSGSSGHWMLQDYNVLADTWGARYAETSFDMFDLEANLWVKPNGHMVVIANSHSTQGFQMQRPSYTIWDGAAWSAPVVIADENPGPGDYRFAGSVLDPASGSFHVFYYDYNFSPNEWICHRMVQGDGVISPRTILGDRRGPAPEIREDVSEGSGSVIWNGKLYIPMQRTRLGEIWMKVGSPVDSASITFTYNKIADTESGVGTTSNWSYIDLAMCVSADNSKLILIFTDTVKIVGNYNQYVLRFKKMESLDGLTWSAPTLWYSAWPSDDFMTDLSITDIGQGGIDGIGLIGAYPSAAHAFALYKCSGDGGGSAAPLTNVAY